jgi:hypothetical protein
MGQGPGLGRAYRPRPLAQHRRCLLGGQTANDPQLQQLPLRWSQLSKEPPDLGVLIRPLEALARVNLDGPQVLAQWPPAAGG